LGFSFAGQIMFDDEGFICSNKIIYTPWVLALQFPYGWLHYSWHVMSKGRHKGYIYPQCSMVGS
jgi:hypothetical protein